MYTYKESYTGGLNSRRGDEAVAGRFCALALVKAAVLAAFGNSEGRPTHDENRRKR